MKNKFIVTLLISLIIISVVSASMLIPANDKAREKGKLDLTPPGLEKVVFIHYKKEKGYGRVCDNDGVCESGENPSCADCKKNDNGEEESTCYAFLGAKWKELPVKYVIHPGLDKLDKDAIIAGAEEWDTHTTTELFGTYCIDETASWDGSFPDGRNELLFGDYPRDGVIAVTVIWGYFSGRPSNRRIIEFDILFDTDFTWGDADSDSNVMDLQNIATHELGHGVGLADLYNTACLDETMYGYSEYGDTEKRDLNPGDIIGIQKLYGL